MSRPLHILVVDDDRGITSLLCEELEDAGFIPSPAHSVADAIDALSQHTFDLVVSDLVLNDGRGEEVLRAVRRLDASIPVVIITAFGSIELATELVRKGAADFITKPFTPNQLVLSVSRAIVQRQFLNPKEEGVKLNAAHLSSLNDTVTMSPADVHAPRRSGLPLAELLARASASDANLLLVGESGVGKTLMARSVHEGSTRCQGPFVTLNCAAISPTLVESELFGVVQGAFTDAKRTREGLFRSANGGTLFLDEVGEMPIEAQAKLLRVLETRVVRSVGGTNELPINVRVIAATNQSLEQAVAERRFRVDLYYRLHVLRIEIPPLRERREDIVPISRRILASLDEKNHRSFSTDAEAWMSAWSWPGNVRELANRIERALALSDRPVIEAKDLMDGADTGEFHAESIGGSQEDFFTPRPLVDVEREHIRATLRYTRGNKSQAAELLGIDRKTLYRKLGELEERDES